MELQGSSLSSNIAANEDILGTATSVEEITSALTRDSCSDLTPLIDLTACSNFPTAGGGFCNVYQGSLYDGRQIAIKSLRAYDRPEVEGDNDWRQNLRHIAKELRQWSRLQHCNVLPLMGLAVFRGHISMVSQWVENGDLMSYLRCNPDVDRIRLCVDICAGMCYIHTSDLIHGDLKATNVLVSSDGTALIADFGNAEMENFVLMSTNRTKGGLSVRWAAPELLADDDPHVSKEADVYAYGMTVLEVFTGEVPYPKLSDIQVLRFVAFGENVQPRPDSGMLDNGLWKILNWCWVREPSERPAITSVNYCLHALFPPIRGITDECGQALVRNRLGGNSSKESSINDGLKEPGRLRAYSVPQQLADSISDQERKRQEAINELICAEHDFVRDLEYLRDRWMEPLRTEYIIPLERRAEFVQQVFWNLEDLLNASTHLRDRLTKRQNTHPIVESIGDIILELVSNFLLSVQYGEHLLYGRYEFEKEKSMNPAFQLFLETVERLESRKLEMNEYLVLPTTRLARYPPLLEAVLKYTPEDHEDRVTIPQVVRKIGEFLEGVNRIDDKFKLLELNKGLVSRQGMGVHLELEGEQSLLVYKGLLELRGRTAHENSNLQTFLFDDVLVMIQSKLVDEHEQREIFRRPIPLELLFVSTPPKKTTRPPGLYIPFQYNPVGLTPHGSTLNGLVADGLVVNGSVTNGLVANGPITNGSVGSGWASHESAANGTSPAVAPAQPGSQKSGYRLTVSHLGRKGYSLVLWAPTSATRRQWIEHIKAQQNAIREKNMIFHTVTRMLVGQAKVNCAVPYDHGRRIAYGTDAGVYFQSLYKGQNPAPIKALDLVDVQQIDVLQEFQLLVVLSGRSVLTYPLDTLDTANMVKRMKRISSYASFFKTGHCSGRTMVCVVKSGPLFSTIKTLEPVEQNTRKKNKPTSEQQPQDGNKRLRVIKWPTREFSIPTQSRSVHFLGARLCIVCDGGLQIIDLDTLDTYALLDFADISLKSVQRHEDLRPLSIYKIDDDYLLCYTDFAFYVNESGSRSRKGMIIHWEGAPTAFALRHPHIMAFDPTFIEIRHVDNGSLVQVIQGNNLRLLFADIPSITNSSTSSPSLITGGPTTPHPYEGRSPEHGDYPHEKGGRDRYNVVASEPALAQQEQRPPPERDDIIVVSGDKVMAVRPVVRRPSEDE